jgi:hypothetical protein
VALAQRSLGINGVRHCDPNGRTHERHVQEAKRRRVVDRVVVDVTRDDAVRLNALGDQWEKHWVGWQGDTFLVEQTTYCLSSGRHIRTKLKSVSGREFTAAVAKTNRLDWYWSTRRDKGVIRKVKRKVERNRTGRICDRHTVSLSPPQMRLIQKLDLDLKAVSKLTTYLHEKSVQFFAERTGRHVVGTARHADSGILHWDHVSARLDSNHNLCGEKSLPSLSNESWTIGAWRQQQLGCKLSETKAKWLTHNLDRFRERHGERQPILLQLHEKLDLDFEQWIRDHGHSSLWEQSKQEYREWVGQTDKVKEKWADERASGKTTSKLAEKIAMQALRLGLPPKVYRFVRNTMTAAHILSDLMELETDANTTGLLLQITLAAAFTVLRASKGKSQSSREHSPISI